MKNMHSVSRKGCLSATGLALLLSACASRAPTPVETAGVEGRPVVTPEMRSEFDAAMRLLQEKDVEKGIRLLNSVATQSQKNAVPHINLAMANRSIGQLQAAEQSLKRALEIEPDNPVASNELGLVYRMAGRFDESRLVYEGILKRYPRYPVANKNLAILCDLYLRDYVCALKGYEAYSAAVPEDKSARVWIADVQKRIGQ